MVYKGRAPYSPVSPLLTVDVALLALVLGAEAVACDFVVVVDALGPDEAQVLPLVALVQTALVHVLVLGGNQRSYGQQIRSSLSRAQHHVPYAPDERLDNVLNAVQLLLGAQTWARGDRERERERGQDGT